MTQEDKEILLKDLCARLPYGVKGTYLLKCDSMHPIFFDKLNMGIIERFIETKIPFMEQIADIKPYLRPMSSMTSDEWCEYCDASFNDGNSWVMAGENRDLKFTPIYNKEDFLNAHHFDYRGLIEKGLALEAPESMYNIK